MRKRWGFVLAGMMAMVISVMAGCGGGGEDGTSGSTNTSVAKYAGTYYANVSATKIVGGVGSIFAGKFQVVVDNNGNASGYYLDSDSPNTHMSLSGTANGSGIISLTGTASDSAFSGNITIVNNIGDSQISGTWSSTSSGFSGSFSGRNYPL